LEEVHLKTQFQGEKTIGVPIKEVGGRRNTSKVGTFPGSGYYRGVSWAIMPQV